MASEPDPKATVFTILFYQLWYLFTNACTNGVHYPIFGRLYTLNFFLFSPLVVNVMPCFLMKITFVCLFAETEGSYWVLNKWINMNSNLKHSVPREKDVHPWKYSSSTKREKMENILEWDAGASLALVSKFFSIVPCSCSRLNNCLIRDFYKW